jgi:hypothetical protein
MALKLQPAQSDYRRLQALAASGKSGVARTAQSQLQHARTAQLRREMGQ